MPSDAPQERIKLKRSLLKIPGTHIDFIFLAIMAFPCAIVLLLNRDMAANRNADEWLLRKQATAISCNKTGPNEPGSSRDKDDGGGCAHQFGGSCPLIIDTDKRNKTHTC